MNSHSVFDTLIALLFSIYTGSFSPCQSFVASSRKPLKPPNGTCFCLLHLLLLFIFVCWSYLLFSIFSATLLKLTIPRIKLLRNRREVQLKQMRNDVAMLLEAGQETKAVFKVSIIPFASTDVYCLMFLFQDFQHFSAWCCSWWWWY